MAPCNPDTPVRRERFKLLVEIKSDDPPAVIILRRFLKMALRSFGIKCIACEAADYSAKGRVSNLDGSTGS